MLSAPSGQLLSLGLFHAQTQVLSGVPNPTPHPQIFSFTNDDHDFFLLDLDFQGKSLKRPSSDEPSLRRGKQAR